MLLVVPGLLFRIKAGGPMRVAVVDQTGRMYDRVRDSILRSDGVVEMPGMAEVAPGGARQMPRGATQGRYEIEQGSHDGQSFEQVKRSLSERVRKNELDAYLVLMPDILESGGAEYYGRNLGDLISVGRLRDRVSRAVIEQRMLDAQIDQRRIDELSKDVHLNTIKVSDRGEEKDSGGSFMLAMGVGLFIYIAILMYGQVILSAVVEEKTTRIVEVLFSSMRAFPLMAGKLIGISLVALTQFIIWAVLFFIFALYGVGALAASGVNITMPQVAPSFAVYALLFFLLGFYIYSTLYALVGSLVTSEKEGSQLAFPVIMLLMSGIYLAFPVIRSPNSAFAFWVSMVPFFSPIAMLVRIVTETPPFWQIALSLLIGIGTVVLLTWIAARIYRIGMLMHGKRASIPEILRWVRQT